MSLRNEERNILAVYDITDPKRLANVAKTLEGCGVRVQYSVFELIITPSMLKVLHEKINKIIDIETDSVRYYIICDTDWQKRSKLGVSVFGEPDWDVSYAIV
ncbi:MAG TPA: CRISPR-associated endonuclease Cas2 [Desulfomonilia bacterium]